MTRIGDRDALERKKGIGDDKRQMVVALNRRERDSLKGLPEEEETQRKALKGKN